VCWPGSLIDDTRLQQVITAETSRGSSKTHARKSKERCFSAVGGSAVVANTFANRTFNPSDLNDAIAVLTEAADKAKSGNLCELESMLVAQAMALNIIFSDLAMRAALNIGEYLPATETYLRLALKAQAQCRATLQTLAEIKNPRAMAFVKQANIAQGPQQVNNQVAADPATHAISDCQSNELLGAPNGKRLEPPAAQASSGADPALEAMEIIHGTEDHRGESD
jgi:hypothetical protein